MLFTPLLIASAHVADDIEAEHYANNYSHTRISLMVYGSKDKCALCQGGAQAECVKEVLPYLCSLFHDH
jgi:hypothetical protein